MCILWSNVRLSRVFLQQCGVVWSRVESCGRYCLVWNRAAAFRGVPRSCLGVVCLSQAWRCCGTAPARTIHPIPSHPVPSNRIPSDHHPIPYHTIPYHTICRSTALPFYCRRAHVALIVVTLMLMLLVVAGGWWTHGIGDGCFLWVRGTVLSQSPPALPSRPPPARGSSKHLCSDFQ